MDFDRIRIRLDALVQAGKKAELRGALNMLNEVDIAEYLETLDNEKMLMVFRLPPLYQPKMAEDVSNSARNRPMTTPMCSARVCPSGR